MLYPLNNRCRTVLDLSGFWDIKIDSKAEGTEVGWQNGFSADAQIAVPGSWNEQLAEIGLMDFVGSVWHQLRFKIPTAIASKKLMLRFGSVDFHAKIWINGTLIGEHSGGYLPFEFEISDSVYAGSENCLVVAVNNELTHETIPQGVTKEDYPNFDRQRDESYPPTAFDFFAYGGIHRPVKLIALSDWSLQAIRVETKIRDAQGMVKISADCASHFSETTRAKISLWDGAKKIDSTTPAIADGSLAAEFTIPACKLWSPDCPHLYKLHFELFDEQTLVDEYELDVGVREIAIEGDKLLLNGKPVFLRGFGKHEDFAVLGKGLSLPVVIKDFQLMKWIGANSFRTAHYPYAEEVLQLADRMGFLVIDECPAVSLNFRHATPETLKNHRRSLTELIARDRNHPCVISWSLANEPGIWLEEESQSQKAEEYLRNVYNHAKQLDSSRPTTMPTFSKIGLKDLGNKYCDFISVNRYWGWYEIPVDLERASKFLKAELEEIYKTYKKPILISEFGADTIEGQHSTTPQLFTEEYQTAFLETYFKIIESLSFTIGEHIWNFADFRTAQHFRRVILNKKGIFTRDRMPKSAAFAVRNHWRSRQEPGE